MSVIVISIYQYSMPYTHTHRERERRETMQFRALTHLSYIQAVDTARAIFVLVIFRLEGGLLKMRIRTQMRRRSCGEKLLLLLMMMKKRLWWLRLWHSS